MSAVIRQTSTSNSERQSMLFFFPPEENELVVLSERQMDALKAGRGVAVERARQWQLIAPVRMPRARLR